MPRAAALAAIDAKEDGDASGDEAASSSEDASALDFHLADSDDSEAEVEDAKAKAGRSGSLASAEPGCGGDSSEADEAADDEVMPDSDAGRSTGKKQPRRQRQRKGAGIAAGAKAQPKSTASVGEACSEGEGDAGGAAPKKGRRKKGGRSAIERAAAGPDAASRELEGSAAENSESDQVRARDVQRRLHLAEQAGLRRLGPVPSHAAMHTCPVRQGLVYVCRLAQGRK